jgi:cyclophilin family peptidyl-prolyl cis-trans isomerase
MGSWREVRRWFGVGTLAAGLGLAGCSSKPEGEQQAGQPGEGGSATVKAEQGGTNEKPEAGKAGAAPTPSSQPLPPPPNDRMHQPFKEAVRGPDNPPEGSQRPPDQTATGKSVCQLLKEVSEVWDTIRFATPDGKFIDYTAAIETDLGVIEMAFYPEVAPNHVRSFLALAKVGYYEGLCFDRIYYEESMEEKLRLEQVQAGCPLGTGEPGYGSIGYWLRQEVSDKLTHEEGTVGAYRDLDADSAACKFYINLTQARYLDSHYTIFGKVTRGLDVVRKIYSMPVIISDRDLEGSRQPEKPVKIRKVTVTERIADRPAAVARQE